MCADAPKPQRPSRDPRRARDRTQRAVADDAGAEQRRDLARRQRRGHAIHERRRRHGVLGEAAVHVPAGEARLEAEVLVAARAEAARAAGAVQPGDPDAIAGAPRRDARPAARDAADHLMTGHDLRALRRELALDDVQVGAADAAHLDAHQHLAGPRLGHGAFDERERTRRDVARRAQPHRPHDRYSSRVTRSSARASPRPSPPRTRASSVEHVGVDLAGVHRARDVDRSHRAAEQALELAAKREERLRVERAESFFGRGQFALRKKRSTRASLGRQLQAATDRARHQQVALDVAPAPGEEIETRFRRRAADAARRRRRDRARRARARSRRLRAPLRKCSAARAGWRPPRITVTASSERPSRGDIRCRPGGEQALIARAFDVEHEAAVPANGAVALPVRATRTRHRRHRRFSSSARLGWRTAKRGRT